MRSAVFNRILISELEDPFEMPVKKFKAEIEKIETKYGKNAKITFNAGYNNVSCYVKPSKKQRK